MKITLYKANKCPDCLLVENYLLAKNINFDEVIISNSEQMDEVEQLSGQRTVPIIKTEEKIIVGFQQEELRVLAS